MEREEVQGWLDRYVAAWKSYDREQIAELFAEDAEYRDRPFAEPVRGRAAVVEFWLEGPDEPGTYEGDYSPVAIDGNIAVAVGSSTYRAADGSIDKVYDNCFVMRFDAGGRCSSYTEWFMERARPSGS
jgi:hypothetical protein